MDPGLDHSTLPIRNPSTGETVGRVPRTDPAEVAPIVARADEARRGWEMRSIADRSKAIARWWAVLSKDAEAWANAIREEIGKPTGEAMAEVVSTLDMIRWTVRKGPKALRDEPISRGWQVAMMLPPARLRWVPYGVVGIIGTWNYPMLLNAPAIAQALLAGNAVVWKPSELAPGLGDRLARSLAEAEIPGDLVATVQGTGDVGRALVEAPGLARLMFTGGVENGRKVIAEAGSRGVSTIAELAGFDPAVVLADAPMGASIPPICWGAFVGAGQTCVAIKRVYVEGDAPRWAGALADAARRLRVGDPNLGEVDLGPMISLEARERFHATIGRAVEAGARLLEGGRFADGPGAFYRPTVLLTDDPSPERQLAGCFGPVVVVRGVKNAEEAVEASNASGFGLSASVWGRDVRRANAVASRIDAGMVDVNDAVFTSAHASAPFGGRKVSGFGRVRGAIGLRDLAQPQVIHARKVGGIRPYLFPYGPSMPKILSWYRWAFHRRG